VGVYRRKGGLRITKNGVKYRAPSLRVGNKKSGINISKSGVSYSGKVGPLNANSKRGLSITGCMLPVFFIFLFVMVIINT
jgi:hypothetical protein